MRRVIIESPYAGNVARNVDYAKKLVKWCLNNNYAPMASHLLYTNLNGNYEDDDDPVERHIGISAGLKWTEVADMVICGVDYGISSGMRQGIARAIQHHKPIIYRRILPLPHVLYILISGKRYSGKDTIADYLTEFLDAQKIGFSYSLKELFCTNNDIDLKYMLTNQEFKEEHRHQLIDYAQKLFDEKGELCLVKHLVQQKSLGIVVIPDVRFLREVEYFRNNFPTNSLFVRVTCQDSIREKRGWKPDPQIDESFMETNLDSYTNWDVTIDNNTENKEDLFSKVHEELVYKYDLFHPEQPSTDIDADSP